jgi:hypothetical protein
MQLCPLFYVDFYYKVFSLNLTALALPRLDKKFKFFICILKHEGEIFILFQNENKDSAPRVCAFSSLSSNFWLSFSNIKKKI